MENFAGKTAVITGGASGMGRAFADRFGAAGMRIVLADIEQAALDVAADELQAAGVDVIAVRTDVSSEDDVARLAQTAIERGPVNVLCLNAGVGGGGGMIGSLTTADWQWTLGVNVWGIIHGLAKFLPHLKSHGDGHVVITASVAGHTSYPGMAPYNVSKHAAVTIAETLFAELRAERSTVGVTCLCPGIVRTRIAESQRNRPEHLVNPALAAPALSEADLLRMNAMRELFAQAKPADEVAELVYAAVRDRQFWLFTDGDYDTPIAARHSSIRDRTDPPVQGAIFDQYLQ